MMIQQFKLLAFLVSFGRINNLLKTIFSLANNTVTLRSELSELAHKFFCLSDEHIITRVMTLHVFNLDIHVHVDVELHVYLIYQNNNNRTWKCCSI